ncbi:DDT domain-containing protein PTM [Mercurialis annua]|uniref:DDT domain-containing protein PTM n=1 Tax=Mercurialis annua TaxID=3986 RepID=UPI002160EB12|nr:DDT domain-containing protein PTM [Mercurialis annua]
METEFIGKLVKKEFKERGVGVVSGIVQSYDVSSGYFEILYEDGDSERLDFSGVASLLRQSEEPADHERRRGRPKKRRRVDLSKVSKGGFDSNCGSLLGGETLGNGNFDLNDGLVEGYSGNLRNDVDNGVKEVLDLNAGFNLNLNEGFDLNDEGVRCVNGSDVSGDMKMKNRECIDLNLEVNGDIDESLSKDLGANLKEREIGFDLNLQIDEEEANGERGRLAKEISSSEVLEGIANGACFIANGMLQEVHVTDDLSVQLAKGILKKGTVSIEGSGGVDSVNVQDANTFKEDSPEVINEKQSDVGSVHQDQSGDGPKRRGRRRKTLTHVDNLNSTPETVVVREAKIINGNQEDVRSLDKEGSGNLSKRRRGRPPRTLNSTTDTAINAETHFIKEDCNVVTDEKQGDIESVYTVIGGKNRRLSDHVNATPERTVLRRSARRGLANNDVLPVPFSVANEFSVSPAVSALTEEIPLKLRHEWDKEPLAFPAKVQLPPSSRKLDLAGIPVVDFFSVYACLRSFSTLLFLSPFELEEFVAALRCSSSSSLFDSIHVCILQALKKHMDYLSNEGSESASNCLRSLNWGFLDVITWPVFLAEYLLFLGSDFGTGIDPSLLMFLKIDYYKQPVSLKIEILRYLCDTIIEADAFRSELARRSSGADADVDFDRNINSGALRKRRSGMDASIVSALTEDAVDDSSDWNSDECCLCKMDGSLICCDGCPAAYHSKCVGVVNDSLPEGDWFCPECAIERQKPWMKTRKSLRGAELLGADPCGRLYFSSCGYLLVSDSCEPESSFSFYHKDDFNGVIQVLRSSEVIYGSILEVLLKHWDIPVNINGASNLDTLNHDMCVLPSVVASSEAPGDIHIVGQTCLSSEGSAETIQTSLENHNSKTELPSCSNKSTEPLGDDCLTPKKEIVIGSSTDGCTLTALNGTNADASQGKVGTGYLNYYSFGHTASLVAEDFMRKPSDKKTEVIIMSAEEIISAQMKIMSKSCAKFHWPNIPSLSVNIQKENCGWCFSCRASSDDSGCLFNMSLAPVGKGSLAEVVGLQSKRNKIGHLIDIVGHILVIEDRLQGLLLGPWLNPHYSKLWRKSILKASDIVSVKHLLLTLESNISRLALSAEWLKHVDVSTTVGSASHIIIASSRASSKNGIGKKKARYPESDSNPSSNSSSGLSMLWWRGGRVSRRLFSWKAVPCSLVSKAARQAGSKKILGVVYPENSDFAKRSKYIAWRAAVELSTTVEQLALQVREFDSNIKWDEILNTISLPMADKDCRKSIRLFKKAIIRRKAVEAEVTKYLLDFGKRRCIPEIVIKKGSAVEESASERKKYWLNESYVPLHLLKSFEEKRIARRSSKMSSGKLSDADLLTKKPLKERGFSYLLAKAERPEYHQCRHCNKDVPIREAVCCQYCQGSFHKRHVRKSMGSVSAQCKYTCHRCVDGNYMKVDSETAKNDAKKAKKKNRSSKNQYQKSKKVSEGTSSVHPKNSKKTLRNSRSLRSEKNKKVTIVVPLRRSPRKAKLNALQNKKARGRKKGKPGRGRPKKVTGQQPTKATSWRKKRTQAYHSYWLNGLLLTRKPEDERVMHFRKKRFVAPSQSVIYDQPTCRLCSEAGYTSTVNYISCEMCGGWFHGDALGLDAENINKLIGFRCHMCRNNTPPVCPFASLTKDHESSMDVVENSVANEFCAEGTGVKYQTEVNLLQESHVNEDNQGSLHADNSPQGLDDKSFVPESKLEIGNEIDQMEPTSCSIGVDVMESESIELHPQLSMESAELLDEGGNQVPSLMGSPQLEK